MTPTAKCKHQDNEIVGNIYHLEDSGRHVMELQARCRECNEPYLFVGFDCGFSFTEPRAGVPTREHLPPDWPDVASVSAALAQTLRLPIRLPSEPDPAPSISFGVRQRQ